MECSRCGAANPAGNKFCGECGTPLASGCPACGTVNPADKKFCGECGTPLTAAAASPYSMPAGTAVPSTATSHAHPSIPIPVAERRVCSVLFCDLVGFTPLSELRDPEEVRELLSRYFEVARTVISRYGGVVEKFIGDAVMAVWGTPSATEEDGERAVRAALELIDAVAELGREAGAAELAARAGVVTGPVAVTVGATGEGMVAGDAVNTAARVQAAANPGAVLVDERTRRVAEAAIGFSSAGEHVLKGKAEPVPLWRATRVVGGAGGSQRIDGLEAGFVGRHSELRLVKELFHACEQRRTPRLVSVTGAAGVGKSRLGWEFRKYIDGLLVTVWWHQGRCLSYGDGVAFWALAEMVRQRLQIADEDSTPVAAKKLAAGLERLLEDPAERAYVGPRLGQLLGVEYGETAVLPREELFAGWRLFFERLATTGPVVMVVEDLQHADTGLLDFLEHLLDWARDVPIFVLTLARPELEARRAGWGTGRRNSTALTLDPLDDAAMDALLEGLVPGMPTAGKTAIAGRAEGIPLYAVETVRMLIDRDIVQPIDGVYRLVGDVGELTVPATLQSLLAARLDTLHPDERRLVADAAVLGGTFPAEALIAVSGQPEPQVRRLLSELIRREVLAVRADPLSPQRGHYAFVQTMFRQVAYDTLSRRERKARHLAVAEHLQTVFADQGEEIAEVIATHLLDALRAVPDDPDTPELRTQTVAMLSRAGERAERTGAPTAASTAYTTAANLLQSTGGAENELAAAALWERAGKAADLITDYEAELSHLATAAGIYRRHHRERAAARADTGTGAVLDMQGRTDEARKILRQALTVLEAGPDADTVDALRRLATLEAFAGNREDANRLSFAALEQGQALGVLDATMARLLTTRATAHVFANRIVQAVACLREAVRRAEMAADSASLGHALGNLTALLVATDPPAAVGTGRDAVAHSQRIGSAYHLAGAAGNLLQALLLTGQWEDAHDAYAAAVRADERVSQDVSFAESAVIFSALRGDAATLAEVSPMLESWVSTGDPQDEALVAVARAAVAHFRGSRLDQLRHAQHALTFADEVGLSSDFVPWAVSFAAGAALALGDGSEVHRLLEWLDDHPVGHIPAVLRAEGQRLRAGVLASRADPSTAAAYDEAIQQLRQLGSPYHLAVGLLDQAEYLEAHDFRSAEQLVTEAQSIARRLGAKPLLERAARLAGAHASEQAPRLSAAAAE